MADWRRGGRARDDDVDDFDEYDPTPYGGGYDLALTFGRPVPPSDDNCYPITSSSSCGGGGIDYERPHYSSESRPSPYEAVGGGGEATEGYGGGGRYGSSSSRPKPHPAYGFRPQQEVAAEGEYGGRRPQPKSDYDFQPGINRPSYGGGGSQYGYVSQEAPASDYGSGYGGGRPKREEKSSYGYGYEQDHPKPKPYGEEQGYDYEGNKYKSGNQSEYGGGKSDGGGKSEYRRTEEYGYGGSSEYKKSEEYGYGGKPSYERPSYVQPEEETVRYQKPGYYNPNQRGGYSRPKCDEDSDGEEKKRRHHKHHHRKYDDDE